MTCDAQRRRKQPFVTRKATWRSCQAGKPDLQDVSDECRAKIREILAFLAKTLGKWPVPDRNEPARKVTSVVQRVPRRNQKFWRSLEKAGENALSRDNNSPAS